MNPEVCMNNPIVPKYIILNFVVRMSHVHVKAIQNALKIKKYASTYIILHKIHLTMLLIVNNNLLLTS